MSQVQVKPRSKGQSVSIKLTRSGRKMKDASGVRAPGPHVDRLSKAVLDSLCVNFAFGVYIKSTSI